MRWGWSNRSGDSQRGAALVEMAFVAPLLMMLIFGIIEFGWKFGQFNEIRHAAREGARYAAVSDPDLTGDAVIDANDVLQAVCDALNLNGTGTVDVVLTQAGTDIGNTADVTLTVDAPTLSGVALFNFLPTTLSNQVHFRLEQEAEWSATTFSNEC